MNRSLFFLLLMATASPTLAQTGEPPLTLTSQPADKSGVRLDWIFQHQTRLKHLREQKPEIVFLGDSITDGWRRSPLFVKKWAPLKAFNAGIGGDSTQHVLWRVEHGIVETQPRLVILLIGINNLSNGYTPEQTAAGVTAIVRAIAGRSPESRMIVMGILPRGEAPGTRERQRVEAVNRLLAPLAQPGRVVFLDIGDQLLDAEGRLSREIAPDGLHLGEPGYQRWHDALFPVVENLLSQP